MRLGINSLPNLLISQFPNLPEKKEVINVQQR